MKMNIKHRKNKEYRPKDAPKDWEYHFWCPCDFCLEAYNLNPKEPTDKEIRAYIRNKEKMPFYKVVFPFIKSL